MAVVWKLENHILAKFCRSIRVLRCQEFSVTDQYLTKFNGPPKKPVGAFFSFFMNNLDMIRHQNPSADRPTQAKIAGEMWREIDIQKKEKLLMEARERMQEYQRQYAEFLSGISEEEKKEIIKEKHNRHQQLMKRRKKSELKKLGKPKCIRKPYILYLQSIKQTRGDTPFKFYMDNVANQWKNLPQDQKEIFYEKTREDKERYFKEMADWEQKMKEIGREDLIRGYKKQSRSVKRVVKVKAKTKKSARKKKSTKTKTSKNTKNTKKLSQNDIEE